AVRRRGWCGRRRAGCGEPLIRRSAAPSPRKRGEGTREPSPACGRGWREAPGEGQAMKRVPKPPPGKRPLKTLERVLSKAGVGSRTEAREWIAARRVRVNGRVITDPDTWVDLKRDSVLFADKPLQRFERTYLLLYKPKGYLTTYDDPRGRPTIYD